MSAWGPWLGWHLSELLSMYLMLEVAAGMQIGKCLNWMGLMWIAGGAESGLEASGKKGHRFGLWSAAARPIPLRAQTLRKLTGISYGGSPFDASRIQVIASLEGGLAALCSG